MGFHFGALKRIPCGAITQQTPVFLSVTKEEGPQYLVPSLKWWMWCSKNWISMTCLMQYPEMVSCVFHIYTMYIFFSNLPAQWLIQPSIITQSWILSVNLLCWFLCSTEYWNVCECAMGVFKWQYEKLPMSGVSKWWTKSFFLFFL